VTCKVDNIGINTLHIAARTSAIGILAVIFRTAAPILSCAAFSCCSRFKFTPRQKYRPAANYLERPQRNPRFCHFLAPGTLSASYPAFAKQRWTRFRENCGGAIGVGLFTQGGFGFCSWALPSGVTSGQRRRVSHFTHSRGISTGRALIRQGRVATVGKQGLKNRRQA